VSTEFLGPGPTGSSGTAIWAGWKRPCLIVDFAVGEQNTSRFQSLAKAARLSTCPNIKTHKRPHLKQRQITIEAAGITCAKIDEAKVRAAAGFSDILITYNTLGAAKLDRLAALAGQCRLTKAWRPVAVRTAPPDLRRSLYLPAVVATRFKPDMKVKYDQLVASGKCKKLAITAIMRKLLVMANSLLRDRRKWTKIHP
jgi:hypothetical protein